MEQNLSNPVIDFLRAKKIPFRLFRHPGPILSLEQAAMERGQSPNQVVRSIVFRIAKDEYVMVLMPGKRQVSWPALRQYLGKSRLSMASDEDVFQATGYQPGAISPFGLPKPIRILVDHLVLEQAEVSIGSGERGLTVILKTSDLLTALESFELEQFTTNDQGIL